MVLLTSIGLTGCESARSLFEPSKIDYRSAAQQRPTLEVPPDLNRLEAREDYRVAGGSVLASNIPNESNINANNVMGNAMGDVTLKRDGDKRWLLVERTPEQIWSHIEAFWQDIGFILVLDEPKLGIMETDWAENRAKIPQDFIRKTLGAVFNSLYSTGERDKFRTRIEVTAQGTEIFITHRGVEEVYSSNDKTTTMWQPRASDPELEAEMLRRLMMRLGVSEEKSIEMIQQVQTTPERAQIVQQNGQSVVKLNENFDNAWRWVGISLDRISFTVVDRDRSQGIYRVRYVDPVADTKATEKGLLSGLFNRRDRQNTVHNYQIKLTTSQEAPDTTWVAVLDDQGKPVDEQIASRIVGALVKDLN